MSKIIYIQFRGKEIKKANKKLYRISKKIEPDNIIANEPEVYQKKNTIYSIVNPVGTVTTKNESILLGHCSSKEEWSTPLNPIDDGSYAIIRDNNEMTELLSDTVGSRAIWYFKNNDIFIVSTSQRAIVLYLENFDFNEKIIPWMLSTGSLGPNLSWDKRIHRLKANSSIILHKHSWELEEKTEKIIFSESKRTFVEHKNILLSSINSTFRNFSVDLKKWILPLSGGYDSRAILYLVRNAIQNVGNIQSITWGLAESIDKERNDAFVAKQVAKATGIQHRYYHTDISSESIEVILKRFVENGEGRIDHISGYTDGFSIWKTLFENGVAGTIRGDEGFGIKTVASPLRVRYRIGCGLCTDYANLSNYRDYGIPEQENPEYMLQKENESLYTWGDRLYHQYRIPTVLSALSDLKLGYVEQLTPLMSDKIVKVIRTLPDSLRTEKLLFKKIMKDFKPHFKYATNSATSSPKNILKSREMVSYLKKELKSTYASTIFSSEFLEMVINNAKITEGKQPKPSIKHKLHVMFIKFAPQWVKNRVSSNSMLSVDPNILLLRVYIIMHMHRLLTQDRVWL